MTLLYFSPVPWDSYPQRPHYFIRHFLEDRGTRVVWVDPYPTRLPTVRDFRTVVAGPRVIMERPADLTVVSLRALPLEPLMVGRWLNRAFLWNSLARRVRTLVNGDPVTIGVGRPSGLAVEALRSLRPARSFYDAMDDFPEFYHGVSKESVSAHEREIARMVDVVVTSSSALWNKFENLASERILLHNAFEMSALPPVPATRSGHPIFGYVGCIGAWFDWSLVIGLARNVRDAAVHIVGPCFSPPPGRLPSNIKLFPACPLSGAIEHFREFSVGLIPFKRTVLTDGIDPVKYYGYRAMGLPVLSTTFGEMTLRGQDDGVFFMDQEASLADVAARALEGSVGPAAVEQFRREHTWERRFANAAQFDRALSWTS